MEVSVVSPDNTSMVGITVPKTAFKAYAVEEPKTFKLDLSKSKKSVSKGLITILDALRWDIVSLKEISDTSITFESGYALINLLHAADVRAKPRIPELLWTCKYDIQTSEFYRHIKLIKTVSSHVLLTDNMISSVASENMIGVEISSFVDYCNTGIGNTGTAYSRFAADKLLGAAKEITAISPVVSIEIGYDSPVRISGKGSRDEAFWVLYSPMIEYD
jgi:hypothetical protein